MCFKLRSFETILQQRSCFAMAEAVANGKDVEVTVVRNDGTPESMILLTGLKNIFQKQLPKMPKDYIARLIYDR